MKSAGTVIGNILHLEINLEKNWYLYHKIFQSMDIAYLIILIFFDFVLPTFCRFQHISSIHVLLNLHVFLFICCCSIAVMSDSLWPLELLHTRLPVLHYLPEFVQTHVHWVGDAIQPSHPLSPISPPALNLSQHQGLFQWVSSSH